ncbi:MAG: septum formation protein Maf [Desulfovibrionaceae bacterium]|nr:septum formation protein Maf [Desulfovibrionaceae bacterium]MBF0513334.1 septum formation protein Maf [Desulfovibrionaceae bacterium]
MLSQLGIDFTIAAPQSPEPEPGEGETPAAYALRAAKHKALDIASNHPDAFVLAADTVVAVDGSILGKPRDPAGAVRMLEALAGREHLVVTGCCLSAPGGATVDFTVSSKVSFSWLDPQAIAAYVATGEPMDKAGAYAVQGKGAFMVESVHGSYTNVVGLPLCEVVDMLVNFGVIGVKSS